MYAEKSSNILKTLVLIPSLHIMLSLKQAVLGFIVNHESKIRCTLLSSNDLQIQIVNIIFGVGEFLPTTIFLFLHYFYCILNLTNFCLNVVPVPCNHKSMWTWDVEEILPFGKRLGSTRCSEFPFF